MTASSRCRRVPEKTVYNQLFTGLAGNMGFVRREKKTVAWGNLGIIHTIIYKHYICQLVNLS